ncbi:ParB/RepB/Spo0J family partition protein [Ohessyouella blattaphilus]|uniref:ParB/RepB/Spo0J family partition protein n=1 Tax=Ohessyouella blattaphilus TaxID=2949333 RepID=A0ABT1EIE2_9FIRM|nr:ParB/RepB/Spo0J family partition protein [Ohessyouella blattaphilus]MCP1110271.1 ParB/RepB/Spo0J family partition protein [Ohessyouella blattaphilus]MCR8563665.1 ParB/RepB/Spo0J family partition protein [Ohessyouella blattaphilus]
MKMTSADKVELSSFENLFGTEKKEDAEIMEIALEDLYTFKNHPFRVIEDSSMEELIESIKEEGVISPGIARPRETGGYEIIAGHRRCFASKVAGLKTMPFRCKNLTDEEAIRFMLDSNIQRENLLPSEKAFAYRMRVELIKHQGKAGLKSAKRVGNEAGDNERKVYRLIRLTYLLPELLELVDKKKIPVIAGAEISYLREKEQEDFLELVNDSKRYPNTKSAQELKEVSSKGEWTQERLQEILLGKATRESGSLTIKRKNIQKYFPNTFSNEEMEAVIYNLLADWQKRKEGDKGEGEN